MKKFLNIAKPKKVSSNHDQTSGPSVVFAADIVASTEKSKSIKVKSPYKSKDNKTPEMFDHQIDLLNAYNQVTVKSPATIPEVSFNDNLVVNEAP